MADRNWTGLSGEGAALATGSGAGRHLRAGGAALLLAAGEDGRAAVWDCDARRLGATLPPVAADATGNGGAASAAAARKGRRLSGSGGAGHLALRLSVAAWAPADACKQGKQGKAAAAAAAAAAQRHVVGFGTHDGDVLVWDVSAASAAWRVAGAHEGAVRALALSAGGARVFSGGDDGNVCEVDGTARSVVRTFRAAQRPIGALALSLCGTRLLSGASRVTLWDVSGDCSGDAPARVAKVSGHASAVGSAAFAPDGRLAMTASRDEREVALWDARGGAGSSAAVCLLACDAGVASVSSAAVSGGAAAPKGAFVVMALTVEGAAFVWRVSPVGATKKGSVSAGALSVSAPPPCVVRVSGSGGALWGLSSARGSNVGGAFAVTVVHGSPARPTVGTLEFSAGEMREGGAERTVEREATGGALAASAGVAAGSVPQARAAPASAPHVLDAEMIASGARAADKRKRGADAGEGDEDGAVGLAAAAEQQATLDALAGGSGGGELTLGERVARLALEGGGAAGAGGNKDGGKEGPGGGTGGGAGGNSVGSVAVLLAQALESRDEGLLERCLAVGNERQVTASVARLPPSLAGPLVAAAASRLRAKPTRAATLCVWLRACLAAHAATLMASPAAQAALHELYAAVDARTAMLSPLLQLQGRLHLLAAQAGMGEAGAAPVARAEALDAPMATFVDDGDVEAVDVAGDGLDSEEDQDGSDMSEEEELDDLSADEDDEDEDDYAEEDPLSDEA